MFLNSFTNALCKLELLAARFFVATVLVLIILNVITRFAGIPIYWVDELAIYAMIWMIFSSLPVLICNRKNISVDILTDILSDTHKKYLSLLSDIIIFLSCVLLFVFALNWFDPFVLMGLGFDISQFSSSTFNYIYQEPTNTLFFNKFIVWIIIPFSFFMCSFHSALNVISTLIKCLPIRGNEK